jgi:macrodomain Ter protein organizer (MatP/YcbG family)
MTKRKNINLTLSVPPDTRKKLRQLAVDREQSLSEIVIELIDAEYRKVKAQKVLDNADKA